MHKSYLNMLGLAYRARACILGFDLIVKNIKRRRAKLVLIAKDCSKQTRKKITDKCHTYNIPYVIVDDRNTISHTMSQSQRVAIAILDKGITTKIITLLERSKFEANW